MLSVETSWFTHPCSIAQWQKRGKIPDFILSSIIAIANNKYEIVVSKMQVHMNNSLKAKQKKIAMRNFGKLFSTTVSHVIWVFFKKS